MLPVAPPLAVAHTPLLAVMFTVSSKGYADQLPWFQLLSIVPAPFARLPTRGGHATNVQAPAAAMRSPAAPSTPLCGSFVVIG